MSWRKKNQFPAIFFAVVPAAFLLGDARPAYGDRVYLSNGEVMEGIITSQTDESVVLNIGMGAVSVKRIRIERVEEDDEAANGSLRAHWRAAYIDTDDLPKNVQALARNWNQLKNARAKALRAGKDQGRLERDADRLERAVEDRKKQYLAVNNKLAAMSMDRDRKAYNAMVEENNRLVAGVNNAQSQLRDAEVRRMQSRQAMRTYALRLTSFEFAHGVLVSAYAHLGADDLANLWLHQVGQELRTFEHDFVVKTVPVDNTLGGRVAKVTINDEVTGSFVVDTGASVVTVSETMAKRLGLRYDPEKPIPMQLADGGTTDAFPVWLGSLQVGEARAENVQAVVMASAPGPGLDGLLGMSFLNNFRVSFDGSEGEMVLRPIELSGSDR